jgi:predicted dehydrogenase
MNVGIIGYGRMGKLYHKVIDEMGFTVEFICDLEQKMYNLKFFTDYKIALDSCKIDLLIITTYGPSHFEIVKYAIKKNLKYIICEKPFTTSLKHADEIIDLLKNSKSKLSIGYLRRFSDAYSKLLIKLTKNKIIGNVNSIIITSGAGGISTLGTHFIDLCTLIFSEKVKSVYAVPINKNYINPRGKNFEDPGGYFILNFFNEKRAFIDMSDDLGLQPKIEIIGNYGRIEINEIDKKIIGYSRNKEDKNKPMNFYGLNNDLILNELFNFESLDNLVKNLVENLISHEKLKITPNLARDKVEVYSAIRESFDSQKTVNLPIQGEYYEKEFKVT